MIVTASRYLKLEFLVSEIYYLQVVDNSSTNRSYSFSGDPIEIFENFFGTANPFHIAVDQEGKQIPLIEKVESDIHKDFIRDE